MAFHEVMIVVTSQLHQYNMSKIFGFILKLTLHSYISPCYILIWLNCHGILCLGTILLNILSPTRWIPHLYCRFFHRCFLIFRIKCNILLAFASIPWAGLRAVDWWLTWVMNSVTAAITRHDDPLGCLVSVVLHTKANVTMYVTLCKACLR